MYEKLATCFLPIDDLLKELIQKESLERELQFIKDRPSNYPVNHLVTLDLVTQPKIRNVAQKYISKLLENKEKYGYIYYLSGKKMLIPLDIHFQGAEVFVNVADKNEIQAAIERIASEFACKNTLMYEITLMECYYFYIKLANSHLTWLAVESMLTNVKSHAHLIMSPYRKHGYRIESSENPTPCKIRRNVLE